MRILSVLFIFLIISCNTVSKSTKDELNQLTISLEKTACFGTCPVFKIKIFKNGKGIFEGKVEKKRIGVALGYDEVIIKAYLVQVKRTFIESIQKSLTQTQSFFYLTLTTFKNLFTHKADLKDLGGPLAIAHMASSSFLEGIFPYIQFIGLISLNIGILNLLPIPLLDGGYLVYYLIEFVRNKSLSNKNMMISQRVGMLILGLLTAIALYNDACRYLLGS